MSSSLLVASMRRGAASPALLRNSLPLRGHGAHWKDGWLQPEPVGSTLPFYTGSGYIATRSAKKLFAGMSLGFVIPLFACWWSNRTAGES
ncbi:hypothetical protein QOT17_001004 [Balamuthia mandrillaris]